MVLRRGVGRRARVGVRREPLAGGALMRSIVRLVLPLFLCSAGYVLAQVQPPAVRPVFHGTLQLLPASGRIDRRTGSTTLVVSRWTFIPNPDSNGMHPEQEPVLIALGDDSFLIGGGARGSAPERRAAAPTASLRGRSAAAARPDGRAVRRRRRRRAPADRAPGRRRTARARRRHESRMR